MPDERDFAVRPGRIRTAKARRVRTFLATALRAAQSAGGLGSGHRLCRSTFGRGRRASLAAACLLGAHGRNAVIKARVVRQAGRVGALRAHIAYLQRDGVTRDGSKGRLFGPEGDTDGAGFAERCSGDRHHFRFIVSPDDAAELGSLEDFTRALMDQASRDLGTRLDWVGIGHWNTEHPHAHVLVRGRDEEGGNLVIARDYIARGLRNRAGALVTQELGPRADLEIREGLERDTRAERWTRLDRELARDAAALGGLIDLRDDGMPDPLRRFRIGRMRTLERLGFAIPAGAGRWQISESLEPDLRALGSRGDIIKRMHQALGAGAPDRALGDLVLDSTSAELPVTGRLISHGLADELSGTIYAVIDGVDGRVHHLTLPSPDALGDAGTGAIVERRSFTDANGRAREALAVRSDWAMERLVEAEGATWLDRQLLARAPLALADHGFGREVQDARTRRLDHLVRSGLASHASAGPRFVPDLLAKLRTSELARTSTALAAETGLTFHSTEPGDNVSGVYQRRLNLASGRFAMIEGGLGFQLVPWTPSLERRRGQQVDGIAGPGGIEWSRARDLSL